MERPYFVIDADLIEDNLRTLRSIMDRTGCRILLAQKCFSCYALYPMVARYLAGATASGLYEARLCHEEMPGGENHVFAPAFSEEDMNEIVGMCDHIVFNSIRQLQLHGRKAKEAGLQVGLRINPECSTQEGHAIYDPCSPGSRLGVRLKDYEVAPAELLSLLDGLHFHTLCEQNSDDLETTLDAVEERFGKYLHSMRWLNFGGGHHITRADYDVERLERCIRRMADKYGVQVYLEPGEAVALNAGELHCRVMDVQPAGDDGISNAILTTSAACHMPDVIEMPYTPPVLTEGLTIYEADGGESADGGSNAGSIDEPTTVKPTAKSTGYLYRFGGPTCLSGDVIGVYRSERPLQEGDEIVFGDMAIYSMVKTNTFNGMPLPDIYIRQNGEQKLWKQFTYDNFKARL